MTGNHAAAAALYSACLLAPLLAAAIWLVPARAAGLRPWAQRRRAFWILFNLLSTVSIAASLQLLVFDREPDSAPHFTPVAAVRLVARLIDDMMHEPIDPTLYARAENLLEPPIDASQFALAGDRAGAQVNTRQFIALMQQGIRARRPGADRDRYLERIVSIALEADLPEEAMRFLTGFTYRERLDEAVQMVFDYSLESARLELARETGLLFSYRSARGRALELVEQAAAGKAL
jgi:hypothetical protein